MTDRTTDTAVQVRQLSGPKATDRPSKYTQDGRLAVRLALLADAVRHHVPAGDSVLDLSCGSGELLGAIVAAAMRVTECDISPEMLRRGVETDLAKTVDWAHLDPAWQRLPFVSWTFACDGWR